LHGVYAVFERLRIGPIGRINLRDENHLRVEIDHVFRVISEVRRTVFPLRDAAVGVGRTLPLVVGNKLVFAGFVELSQLVGTGGSSSSRSSSNPASFISRVRYSFQSSPVSLRSMLFIRSFLFLTE